MLWVGKPERRSVKGLRPPTPISWPAEAATGRDSQIRAADTRHCLNGDVPGFDLLGPAVEEPEREKLAPRCPDAAVATCLANCSSIGSGHSWFRPASIPVSWGPGAFLGLSFANPAGA